MSSTPLSVSRRAVRRFLLESLDLAGPQPYDRAQPAPANRVLAEVRRLEAVQLDPVAAVERNQHLVLAARVPAYTPAALERLLAQRRVFEYERDAAAFDPAAIRFLAPLDNLLWRRERLVDFFDFTYTWEIYTPEPKRRFGYYTMPILAGDRLIGRIDPRLDRERKRLTVRLVHLEPGVRPTAALHRSLRRALEAFAAFHGAAEVEL